MNLKHTKQIKVINVTAAKVVYIRIASHNMVLIAKELPILKNIAFKLLICKINYIMSTNLDAIASS